MSERDDERERQRRAKRAERERERQKRARAAGLTRSQARSLKKAVKETPSLAGLLPGISVKLFNDIDQFIDATIKTVDKETGELIPSNLQKVIFKRKEPKPKRQQLTDRQRKANKEAGLFKRFVRNALKKDPNVSQRSLPAKYREKTGRSISNDRANEIIRDIRGVSKQTSKAQRYPTVAYGTIGTPLYLTKRYNYVMRYQVLMNNEEDFQTRYMTIQSDTKMTKRELVDEVLRAFEDGELDSNEYYTAVYLDPETIEIDHLIDRDKKTKAYTNLEKQLRNANPDVTASEVAIAYRQQLRAMKKDSNKRRR